MITSPYKQFQQPNSTLHPALQFLIFLLLFIGVVILGNLIGAAIASAFYGLNTVMDIAGEKITSPSAANILWILQIAGTTLPIFLAPVFFAFFIVKEPRDYIKPDFKDPGHTHVTTVESLKGYDKYRIVGQPVLKGIGASF